MDTSEKTEKTTIDKNKIIDIQSNVKEAINTIFNTKTLPYFAGFIVLYASLYFGVYRFYRGRSDVDILFSKSIDIFIINISVIRSRRKNIWIVSVKKRTAMVRTL